MYELPDDHNCPVASFEKLDS